MGGPKLMIFGYARHGKDTVADILVRRFGVTAISSSLFAAESIMVPYFASKGITYPSLADCYADRVNHRAEWFDEIAAYNAVDLAKLTRNLYAKYQIYTGIRNDREFNQAKCEGLFDYSIWVDRSAHLPAEGANSNKMWPWMADYILDNNGTLEELESRASTLYMRLWRQFENRYRKPEWVGGPR
jgi:hypothetical protein